MTRRQRNGRRAALEQAPRGRGGGLLLGIVIGLVTGLIVAAGIAWYLTSKPSQFKSAEQAPLIPVPAPESEADTAAPASTVPGRSAAANGPARTEKAPAATPPLAPAPVPAQAETPAPLRPAQPKAMREPPPPTKSDFTFFDILPGDQTGKSSKPKLSREVWWLQVAALREAKDAERLKARLALLGLPVQMQQVTGSEATLHRVRVGPFMTEDEALGALDTLAENDYEPRLLKEQLNTP